MYHYCALTWAYHNYDVDILLVDLTLTINAGGVAPIGVDTIYQNTSTPLSFNGSLLYTGRPLAANATNQSHIGFEVWLSGSNDISASIAKIGEITDVQLDDASISTLSGELEEGNSGGNTYQFSGKTVVKVQTANCAVTGLFICFKYVVITPVTPAFHDGNTADDVACVSAENALSCTDSKYSEYSYKNTLFRISSKFKD